MKQRIEIGGDVEWALWDLDGTLLNSYGIYQTCLDRVLSDRGHQPIPEDTLKLHYHGLLRESIAAALQDTGQQVAESELTGIVDDFYEADNAFIGSIDDYLFDDAVSLARSLHAAGKRQLIVTNR